MPPDNNIRDRPGTTGETMSEILTGKEGLRAALENPDEWAVEGGQGHWMRYNDWRHLDLILIDARRFRRIQKPREAITTWFYAVVENHGHGSCVDFEHQDFPKGTKVHVTVTENIDGAEPEPDWKARCERAEKERDELQRRIDASAATAAVNTVAARKLHGDHLARLTKMIETRLAEMIETMQGELENA